MNTTRHAITCKTLAILAVLLVSLVLAFRQFRKTEKGRSAIDRFLLRLPGAGSLLQKLAVARFARHVGIAFQILNDLDDWDDDQPNKGNTGTDVLGGRPTVLWALAPD